jgi:molybdopterin-biosynthesis enzyme MoeA-like protein
MDEGMRYPQVAYRNVYIFPGVPSLLQEKFKALRERFRDKPFHLVKLRLAAAETVLAPALNDTVAHFNSVTIGSYPQDLEGREVLITLESVDEEQLSAACAYFQARLPAGTGVSVTP